MSTQVVLKINNNNKNCIYICKYMYIYIYIYIGDVEELVDVEDHTAELERVSRSCLPVNDTEILEIMVTQKHSYILDRQKNETRTTTSDQLVLSNDFRVLKDRYRGTRAFHHLKYQTSILDERSFVQRRT